MFEIKGKVAVVTGGGGVLGGSISESLLKAGAIVIILDIREENLGNRSNQLQQPGQIEGLVCNVLDMDSLKSVREKIMDKYGRIDILINAAGGNIPGATLAEDQTIFDMKIEDFNKVTNLNLNGTVYPTLVFGEAMAQNNSGSIINISSMATYSAITRVPGYSVAKTGVNIFTQWMATEMAQKFSEKIRVNAIAPGFFIGDQNRSVLINPDGSLTERSNKVIAKTPMGRFGDITELNGLVHFLCSDAASFITGAIIPVDGGFSAFSGV
ncbi:MAG: D-mannonate oxidoreductase [Bacteroidetes bacterium GWF2_42_66]|nr:MAG: D-mannonate oxidoreductase [Bacteroidetes bacterium GWA2_42_15]OFX97345.1 MAG: D-mannonate oxidoreductase [Bacteroidetes bacterium GWE2_42_39]OFY39982.1 MAG: D-mannonate oxidoreductase [Bacteroidetes bacterium GWF2_42_66]HBL78176.1 D-mannonate oxidoreductase [Prolixibacteraceae bacterium]HCU61124.1 D-mannonate oxidoreductase [Prolixibacteraceae bacterium]